MKIKELLPSLRIHGRTSYDEKLEALFCNWSCSGFSFGFKGREVKVKVLALSNQIPPMPNMPTPPPDWPCIGLVVDNDKLINRQEIKENKWVTLFNSTKIEKHELRVMKVSENARGKLGILEIDVDGEIYPINNNKPRIEIVGDSITCGFGNEAPDSSLEFKTIEENGWDAYGALAARELGYDFSLICESGIQAIKPEHPLFEMHAMEDIYEYTDELCDVQLNKEKEKWNFKDNHNDIVVINLGTNDNNSIRFYRDFSDIDTMENWFAIRYKEFIKQIRKLNGPNTYICCSLGPMDQYLYHRIKDVVKEIKEETNDNKICCFEYVPINNILEGYGALGHPSKKTHIRMGKELANYIRKFVGVNNE